MGRRKQDLTDMQMAFIRHYMITLNAKQSAISAGYDPAGAGQQGYQLLQHTIVSEEIERRMARRAKKLEITAENILSEIAKIAFSDIRAIASFDNNSVVVKSSKKIHSHAAAAIQSIEQHTSETETSSHTTVKVKLHDKLRALELAGRHLGLWNKVDEIADFKNLTMNEMIALVEQQIAKQKQTT